MKISIDKNFKLFRIENLAVLAMSLYALFLYLTYLNPALTAVQSLTLYAFLGMAMIMVVITGKVMLNGYLMWYLGLIALAFISALYAKEQNAALSHIYNLIVVFGVTFAFSIVLRSKKRIEIFIACLVIGSVILDLYLLFTGQMNTENELGGRFGGLLTGNANTFASLYMVAACSSIYFIISSKVILIKLLAVGSFVLQLYSLILSGGRKFFLVPFIVLYLMLLFKTDKRGKKHIVFYTLVGIAGVIVFYRLMMEIPFLYENIGYRFESFFEYNAGNSAAADASTIERERMKDKAIEYWKEKPIFGHGLNMFAHMSGFNVYSHCNYTELLCNNGVIGLIYYYSYPVYRMIKLWKKKTNDIMKLFLVGVSIALFIYDYGAVTYLLPVIQSFILISCAYINMDIPEDVTAEAKRTEEDTKESPAAPAAEPA